jgi:hypothetical protein
LFQKVGTKLFFYMALHLQIDGQTKRVNGVVNQYFRNNVNVDQRDWDEDLGLAKFCYNFTMHLVTKMSPFELVWGKGTKKFTGLTIPMGWRDHSKKIVEMVKGRKKLFAWTNKFLEHVKKWYEKHANKTQRHMEFEVGQHMLLNIQNFKMFNGLAPHFTTKCVKP